MKYVHTKTGEVWNEGQPSTLFTSNFYLLSHQEKLVLGWELVAEETIVVIPPASQSLQQMKDAKKQVVQGTALSAMQKAMLESPAKVSSIAQKVQDDILAIQSFSTEKQINAFDPEY